ncbi:hypothetical protein VN97_g6215 [Penicillium thymicola]|uniref:Uncharacterized protein n=1 Tax=Penicillium thymicola TaxID=293382 RepID=A0AAI9X7P4_PENTH|nr:hypothetical protein VN97_g6215 [Penicillium thymicola]
MRVIYSMSSADVQTHGLAVSYLAIHPGVSLEIHQCSARISTLGGLVQLQFSGKTEWRTYGLTCFHAIWPPTDHRNPEWFNIHRSSGEVTGDQREREEMLITTNAQRAT